MSPSLMLTLREGRDRNGRNLPLRLLVRKSILHRHQVPSCKVKALGAYTLHEHIAFSRNHLLGTMGLQMRKWIGSGASLGTSPNARIWISLELSIYPFIPHLLSHRTIRACPAVGIVQVNFSRRPRNGRPILPNETLRVNKLYRGHSFASTTCACTRNKR